MTEAERIIRALRKDQSAQLHASRKMSSNSVSFANSNQSTTEHGGKVRVAICWRWIVAFAAKVAP